MELSRNSLLYKAMSFYCTPAEKIFAVLAAKGFASSNIVFGIGSYSYQGNTRDSLGFAIKATSIIQDGDEFSIMKDPKTDSGKKSPRGRVKVVGDSYIDGLSVNSDFQYDRLQTVFKDGVSRTISIDDTRNNVAIDVAF
nr:MAG TPA: putative nicotinate phosphoribosyltransferase [Bacteriophage sp.]